MSIRQGLLTLLDRGPMHGYELRRQFETATGNTWPLNVGQVYTTLARLERDGLIAAATAPTSPATTLDGSATALDVRPEPNRSEPDAPESESSAGPHHIYAITRAGRIEVRHWFTTPVRSDAPPRDELAIKLALAAQTPDVDLHAVIQIQRTATMLALQNFTRSREQAGAELSWQLVADSLIFSAEAELRWLDHCEVRLARSRLLADSARATAARSAASAQSSAPVQPAASVESSAAVESSGERARR